MPQILSGTILRDTIREELRHTISQCTKKPTLVIIQVGDRPDSNTYIKQKKLFGEYIGAVVTHVFFQNSVTRDVLLQEIEKHNNDSNVHGILVQLPIPKHLDTERIIEIINPLKDIDGLTSYNTKLLFNGKGDGHLPATSRSIISLLDFYSIPIEGKHVVVVGRSNLVGKPTALALLQRDATVTIAHKETKDLGVITRQAQILVIAIGDPRFINEKYVLPGQTVVDVGINLVEGKLVGDVDFDGVKEIVSAISPVPGGVGPMTVASVFQNLLDAYRIQEQL
ncbi:MAG: bifunctional 5,10-methylenetetrahydrofolate dehydrogenase/5,10-methenyltetrahydrofolate cyclohydrolase [bacterium]|nr:bifunctional 5,10-methylenetetrahydrofolate dehydrogenase/5,10-methenyltetrahydrofolate cyclohydrolase [bacterium]